MSDTALLGPAAAPQQTMGSREAWARIIAATLCTGLLASVLSLGLWAALPALLGWYPTTVSSGSMLPRLEVGDVAVSKPFGVGEGPTVGQVLLYDDPDKPGRLRMHRFVDVSEDGRIITKGDANPSRDSTPVSNDKVLGVAFLRIPYLALPIVWLREGKLVQVGLTGVVLVALLFGTGLARDIPDDEPPPDADTGTGAGPDDDPADASPTSATAGAAAASGAGDDPTATDETAVRPGFGWLRRGMTRLRRGSARLPRTPAALSRLVPAAALLAVLPTALLVRPVDAAFTGSDTNAANSFAAGYFTCVGAMAADSPYLWWGFDEAALVTTAADSSGNGRTGTYSFLRTSRADQACSSDPGYAVTLNGSSGYIYANATSPRVNTFSIEIWFKTTTTRGGKLIGYGNARTGQSSVYDRHLYMTNSGQVYAGVYDGSVHVLKSGTALNDNAWHHVVATLSTAGFYLYVDGARVASDTAQTTAEGGSAGYWRVGYDNLNTWTDTPTSTYFAGTVDNAAVYNTALTAAQVKAHHDAGG